MINAKSASQNIANCATSGFIYMDKYEHRFLLKSALIESSYSVYMTVNHGERVHSIVAHRELNQRVGNNNNHIAIWNKSLQTIHTMNGAIKLTH